MTLYWCIQEKKPEYGAQHQSSPAWCTPQVDSAMGSNASGRNGGVFFSFTLSPFPLHGRFLTRLSPKRSHHQHEDVERERERGRRQPPGQPQPTLMLQVCRSRFVSGLTASNRGRNTCTTLIREWARTLDGRSHVTLPFQTVDQRVIW